MIFYNHFSTDISTRDKHNFRIQYTYKPTWLGRLLGLRDKKNVYVGSGTVWRSFPHGVRCGTLMEGRLADEAARWQFNNDWKRYG